MAGEFLPAKDVTGVRVSSNEAGELLLGFHVGKKDYYYRLEGEWSEVFVGAIFQYVQEMDSKSNNYPKRKALAVSIDETSQGEPAIYLACDTGCSGWIGLSWMLADGIVELLTRMRQKASN